VKPARVQQLTLAPEVCYDKPEDLNCGVYRSVREVAEVSRGAQ
jgi:hypothetical protein